MSKLHNCRKLEIKESPVEGFGVFATSPIKKGEILEEIPFVLFPRYSALGKVVYDTLKGTGFISEREKHFENLRQNLKFKDPEKYYFKWFPSVAFDGDPISYVVLPLGNGPIYNTANASNNAGWRITEKTFIFTAEKDIAEGEEIRTFYGYFVDEPGNIIGADQVFFLALDKDPAGKVKLFGVRSVSPEVARRVQSDAGLVGIVGLCNNNSSGVRIKGISLIPPNNQEVNVFMFPEDYNLHFAYAKIAEYKRTAVPTIRFYIESNNKDGAAETKTFDVRNS